MKTVHERYALAVLLLCALPAAAHHSPAMFDMNQELVLEGTVTEFSWRNPHVYMAIEVVGPDGTPHEQRIEAGPASNLVPLDVMSAERIVHLDQPKHPANVQPTLFGHSIGYWEGETLVVDTVGFAAHPEGYAFDRPSSATKHLVERF